MIYPNSNLPTVSQPWGRAVQKGLETLEATIISNEVNNKARDIQLQNSYIQVNKSVQDIKFAVSSAGIAIGGVNEIKANIYVPGTTKINGTTIETGTLSADKISGGTIDATVSITGAVIKSATTGPRVQIAQTSMKIFSADGEVANITGNASEMRITSGVGSVVLTPVGGSINGADSGIDVDDNGVTIIGDVIIDGYSSFQNSINVLLNSRVQGTSRFDGAATFYSTASTAGISNTGTISSSGNINSPATYANNVQSGRIMYVASNGTYNCATSSARYKQDINPYVVDVNKFFQLEPVSFRYKMAVEQFGEQADIAHGFIAEQAAEIGLDEFVDFQDDGSGGQRPDNFRYIDFTAAMYAVIKSQQEIIKSLSDRIEVLESA